MTRIVVARWLLAALLAGCGGSPSLEGSAQPSAHLTRSTTTPAIRTPAPAPTPTQSPHASPMAADPFAEAPAEIVNRDPLPSCGMEIVERAVGGDLFDADGRSCFWTAWETGRTAEFVSVSVTVEGGHVTEIYRILDGGRVEIFIDWSRDPFGPSPGWVRTECVGLAPFTNPSAPLTPFFAGEGCDPEVELSVA